MSSAHVNIIQEIANLSSIYIPTFRMFKHAHRARSHICDPCVMMAKHNFTHL